MAKQKRETAKRSSPFVYFTYGTDVVEDMVGVGVHVDRGEPCKGSSKGRGGGGVVWAA